MTQITLKQLRFLVALADHRHFRRAAESCEVSQPSLSVQVQNLEELLGGRLVERGRGEVNLTPTGRDVVARARAVLSDVQAIADFASVAQDRLAGTIRLGVQATLGPYLMPRVASSLHQKHPNFKLYIRESLWRHLESELASGVHDVILAKLPLKSRDFVTTPLFQEPILLAVSRDHQLAGRHFATLDDLSDLPVLTLLPEYVMHDQILTLCEEYGAKVLFGYVGTSLDALRQMVAMNMGTSFVPALYAKSEIQNDADVVTLPLKGRRLARSIGLAWRKGAGRASAFNELAAFIREVVKSDFQELDLVVEN